MGFWRTCTVFAAAALAASCTRPGDAPGYPLYPASGQRLPRDQVARLFGPIASVDGQDVSRLGGAYELLPGCHAVLTTSDAVESTNYVAVIGRTGVRYLVLAMRPGYSYIVKRPLQADVEPHLRITVFAQELDPTGAEVQVIYPANRDALEACKEKWDSPG
jgi:hypothetical protein